MTDLLYLALGISMVILGGRVLLPVSHELRTNGDSLVSVPPELEQSSGEKSLELPDPKLALDDPEKRISDEFSIPPELRDRVSFWFDVYSKYPSELKIIHHGLYPWIIFKVVDTAPIINAETPRRRWMRNQKADRYVRSEVERIRKVLRSASRKGGDFKKLSEGHKLSTEEKEWLENLASLDQPLRKASRFAAENLRVQTGQKDFFMAGLRESGRYLPEMEEIFRSHGLPVELTRLPFVESSFNTNATSKVGASGIWQFMQNTGRKFLTVSKVIDERRSPLKATEAAARLLRENHQILYRSWPLAVTAWNHGPSGVRRASRASKSDDISEIITRYRSKRFDFASSNFYSEFLAALYAEKYRLEVYGDLKTDSPLEVHYVKLLRKTKPSIIIEASGMTKEEFLLINPDIKLAVKWNSKLPRGFRIAIPKGSDLSLDTLFALDEAPHNRKSI